MWSKRRRYGTWLHIFTWCSLYSMGHLLHLDMGSSECRQYLLDTAASFWNGEVVRENRARRRKNWNITGCWKLRTILDVEIGRKGTVYVARWLCAMGNDCISGSGVYHPGRITPSTPSLVGYTIELASICDWWQFDRQFGLSGYIPD